MPGGAAGVEVRAILAYSLFVVERSWSLPQFVSFVSTSAAKTFGLYPKKGTLSVGSDADIAIWDPNAEMVLSKENSHMMTDLFPYEGFRVHGLPKYVFVRGLMIKDKVDGECLDFTPRGQFIKRPVEI